MISEWAWHRKGERKCESERKADRHTGGRRESGRKTLKIFKDCNLSWDNSSIFTEEACAAVRDKRILKGLASLQAF